MRTLTLTLAAAFSLATTACGSGTPSTRMPDPESTIAPANLAAPAAEKEKEEPGPLCEADCAEACSAWADTDRHDACASAFALGCFAEGYAGEDEVCAEFADPPAAEAEAESKEGGATAPKRRSKTAPAESEDAEGPSEDDDGARAMPMPDY